MHVHGKVFILNPEMHVWCYLKIYSGYIYQRYFHSYTYIDI